MIQMHYTHDPWDLDTTIENNREQQRNTRKDMCLGPRDISSIYIFSISLSLLSWPLDKRGKSKEIKENEGPRREKTAVSSYLSLHLALCLSIQFNHYCHKTSVAEGLNVRED
jgi:hypothetical protein